MNAPRFPLGQHSVQRGLPHQLQSMQVSHTPTPLALVTKRAVLCASMVGMTKYDPQGLHVIDSEQGLTVWGHRDQVWRNVQSHRGSVKPCSAIGNKSSDVP